MANITTKDGLTPCVAAGTALAAGGTDADSTLSVLGARPGDIAFCTINGGTVGYVSKVVITKDVLTCTVVNGDTDSVIAYLVLRGD
jgi:hypothetical protein